MTLLTWTSELLSNRPENRFLRMSLCNKFLVSNKRNSDTSFKSELFMKEDEHSRKDLIKENRRKTIEMDKFMRKKYVTERLTIKFLLIFFALEIR